MKIIHTFHNKSNLKVLPLERIDVEKILILAKSYYVDEKDVLS